jgi:hypothetical protein
MSRYEAEEYLRSFGSDGTRDLATLYRIAAKQLHPDMPTGSREEWERLQRAKTAAGI